MFTTCSAFFSSLLGRLMTHPWGAGTVRAPLKGGLPALGQGRAYGDVLNGN
jgi:hypothetical protein